MSSEELNSLAAVRNITADINSLSENTEDNETYLSYRDKIKNLREIVRRAYYESWEEWMLINEFLDENLNLN